MQVEGGAAEVEGGAAEVDAPLGHELARAVADRDFATLSRRFDDEARLRALLPAEMVEVVGNEAVVAKFVDWFATFDTVSLVGSEYDLVGDRLLLGYRLELARGDRRWLCAQESFCRISSGRIVAMDLLCSGFRRVERNARPDSDPRDSAELGIGGVEQGQVGDIGGFADPER